MQFTKSQMFVLDKEKSLATKVKSGLQYVTTQRVS